MEQKQVRQSNLELCRIAAILLVLLVHSNFAWCGWPSSLDECNPPMLLVEAFAIIGVNVFVFITGYFSASIKTESIINLLYICLFYAVLRIVVGGLTGNLDWKNLFFISSSNWFIPSYIGLLLFTPWLNAIKLTDYSRMGGAILALLLFEIWFGYLPALVRIDPGFNYGYSVLSFMTLYLLARYIKQCGVPAWFRKWSVTIYIICSILIAVEAYMLLYLFSNSGKNMVDPLNHLVYAYNNPIVIISSIAFFISFEKLNIGYSKFINYCAQSVLAVLLIHASKALSPQMKHYFNHILQYYDGLSVVALWTLGLIAIFAICVAVDQIRIYSYKAVSPFLIQSTENIMIKIHNKISK